MTKKMVKKSVNAIEIDEFFDSATYYTKDEVLEQINKGLDDEYVYKKESYGHDGGWQFKVCAERLETDLEYEIRIKREEGIRKSEENKRKNALKTALNKFGTKEDLIKAIKDME